MNRSVAFTVVLSVAVLITGAGAGNVFAQTASWDTKARERSQVASSAGLTALTKGFVDQAIGSLLEATRADPKDPLPYHLLGLALAMKGRLSEAQDALHKSYHMTPNLSEPVISIGITHYLAHDYDKALNAFRKAHQLNPSLCHIYANFGFAYMRKHDFNKGQDAFRRLINCYPNSQVAYHGLALVKYLTGDFTGARQAADQAQSVWPYPPTVLLLAQLDAVQGDRARALKRIAEYNKLTRKPWQQRAMTAIGYSAQHDFKWDPYLSDNYDNASLLAARMLDLPRQAGQQRSLSRQGKAADAIARAKSALESSGKDFYILHQLGLVELSAGEYSDAAEHFEEALRLSPDCHANMLHLAQALSLDGKAAQASAYVRKFQRLYPNERIAPLYVDIARVDPGLAEPPASAPAAAPLPQAAQPASPSRSAASPDSDF